MTISDQASDVEVSDLFNRMCAAWTAGDAKAYGACFTEDSDYVSYDSSHAKGRAAMVESHDQLFKGVLTGSALVGSVESIRYLRPDVALMHATGSVLMSWRSTLPKRRLSRQTIVAVRSEEGWKVAAMHNGRVRTVKVPSPDSMPSRASRTMTRAAKMLHLGKLR
ncbi:SgcJ/EcaC family oxidoreductase [Arthrobacter sp. UYEF20]|uniref:SgcJ/EcaC family oxidoreductase n=1 Tax=Arthrobacter sp. UYEF20 TaxID=1756363 RepID=UPI00339771AA